MESRLQISQDIKVKLLTISIMSLRFGGGWDVQRHKKHTVDETLLKYTLKINLTLYFHKKPYHMPKYNISASWMVIIEIYTCT